MTSAAASPAGPLSADALPLPGRFTELAVELASGEDLHASLQRLIEAVVQIAGARAGTVRLPSAAGDGLQLVCQCGLPEPLVLAERSPAPGSGPRASANGVNSVEWVDHAWPSLHGSQAQPVGHAGSRVLAVPLSCRGQVLGLAHLYFSGGTALNAATLTLLKTLGDLLGLVLRHASLAHESVGAALSLERQVMAAEVHDAVAQNLAFVKMRMPLLHEAVTGHDEPNALRYCDDVRQAVSGANTNLRHLLSEFRAPMDASGLKHALRSSILMFAQRAQVTVDFDDQAPELRLSVTQESQVFHIVQESLANVAKHAQAQRAWVGIVQRGSRVDVLVDDDGRGLAAGTEVAKEGHFGLEVMRQRAARLGGQLEIKPRNGGGTRVQLSFLQADNPVAPP